ncbi:hypothetical protein EVAR_50469_1 [Eumeta japonica]|uniref:Uncharacterized protein n=1 Tax=Eumeta variegata TaxID=151549 RepID=A0A4C1XVK6_EUMVA|nr:hypothetical protein EVAR_50457_1 [Eumeta japonica]GBP66638.1 hypothetical protein EVAR_50463_1 [Eumeta japonica]GBP66641.1 hypothetical protein EVAR_50466_1 [Eumeta japonica]GBP66644.1 hypothetical protein EVAR_50469_1 [Eumeta japonica]
MTFDLLQSVGRDWVPNALLRELNKFGSHSLQISESSLEDVTIVQLGRSLAIANHTGSVCTAHGPSSSIRDNLRESKTATPLMVSIGKRSRCASAIDDAQETLYLEYRPVLEEYRPR